MGLELHRQSQDAAVAQLWNLMFGFINSMSLNAAVELGIADILHSHRSTPVTLADLAAAVPIPPSKTSHFRRLMRVLVHSGVFSVESKEDGTQGYVLTPVSTLLVAEHKEIKYLSPYVTVMMDPTMVSSWHCIGKWLKGEDTPPTPFGLSRGAELWDWANQCPEFNDKFNKAMACDSKNMMKDVISKCGSAFEGLRSLVDVGGGTGQSAGVIADAFPDMAVTVMDLPHVVEGLQDPRVKFIGGDLYKSIPPADAIFLKFVLHDFKDDESVEILKKCKEAIPSREEGGKVLIVEMVVNFIAGEHQMTHSQYCCDLKMMVYSTGKEREEHEWKRLFEEAGFSTYKITPLYGIWSLIEVYP